MCSGRKCTRIDGLYYERAIADLTEWFYYFFELFLH